MCDGEGGVKGGLLPPSLVQNIGRKSERGGKGYGGEGVLCHIWDGAGGCIDAGTGGGRRGS